MKRIFIGLKVEPGKLLMELISSLKTGLVTEQIKYINPSNIHITLAFLGNTDEERIPQLSSILVELCEGRGKFDLTIKGAGVFRNIRDPRILWAGIEPSANLLQLSEIITGGLKSIGFDIEDRPFRPHLTLGRIKRISDIETLRRLIGKYQDTTIQTVNVNEVIIYESVLLPDGPVYKPLLKIDL